MPCHLLVLSAFSIGGLRILEPEASALLFFRSIIDSYSEVGTLSLPSLPDVGDAAYAVP
jgi:hypothetical protein